MAYKHYHTHLTSRDPAKAVEFYQKIFGAKVLRSFVLYGGVEIWDVEIGGLMLWLSGSTGAEESGGVTERLYGLHHLGLLTDNLEQSVAELKSKGAEFVAGPTSSRSGIKYAFLRAPENTFIELVEMADEELEQYDISPDWAAGEA